MHIFHFRMLLDFTAAAAAAAVASTYFVSKPRLGTPFSYISSSEKLLIFYEVLVVYILCGLLVPG
jgi:hypothetical protein